MLRSYRRECSLAVHRGCQADLLLKMTSLEVRTSGRGNPQDSHAASGKSRKAHCGRILLYRRCALHLPPDPVCREQGGT